MKFIMEDTVIDLEDRVNMMSDEEFFSFCMANPDLPMERDKNGNILIMSPVNLDSGELESEANLELGNWNRKSKLGHVFSSQSGFTLPNGAVRCPDAAWISRERMSALPKREKQRFGHICPDFVIEIRSKTDKMKMLQSKMEEYIENGCRLGFLIDPYTQQAYVYRPGKTAEHVIGFDKSLSGEDVLPGFELDLSLFILK